MGADEVSTLRDLTRRRGILDGLIATNRGRIANTAGDSVLAEFGSAVDAVRCAVEAQVVVALRISLGISLGRADVMDDRSGSEPSKTDAEHQ